MLCRCLSKCDSLAHTHNRVTFKKLCRSAGGGRVCQVSRAHAPSAVCVCNRLNTWTTESGSYRQTDSELQADRQRQLQTDTELQTDRQSYRQTELLQTVCSMLCYSGSYRQTEAADRQIVSYRQTEAATDRQRPLQTDRRSYRQIDRGSRQTDRATDRVFHAAL